MSNPDIPESPQVKLMYEWGQAFVKMDVDLIAKCLHKDYRHIRYPESLGLSEETREEYLKHMAEIIGLWTDNDSTVHSIIDASGKVVVHATSKIKTKIGVEITRESIYIAEITTDEDGSLKIKQVEDFTDSKAHLDFVQAVVAATTKKD